MTVSFFLSTPEGKTIALQINCLDDIFPQIEEICGIPQEMQKYHLGGRALNKFEQISENCCITLFLGLQGGKGGFGSLLKNQAQTRRKIMNWDQSRDREGRRIINSKNESNLIDFFRNKKEEQLKIQKQVDEVKVMQATIKASESNVKLDQKYKNKLEQNEKMIETSLQQAKQKKLGKEKAKKEKIVSQEIFDCMDEFIEEKRAADEIQIVS